MIAPIIAGIKFSDFEVKSVPEGFGKERFAYSVRWRCEVCGISGKVSGDAGDLAEKIVKEHMKASPECKANFVPTEEFTV